MHKLLLPFAALAIVGANSSYANDAYIFNAVYTGEIWANADGGLDEGSAYLDLLDITLEVDTEKAWGLEGGTLFGYIFYSNSETLSSDTVGDIQGVSNIDNTSVTRVMELWYEQQLHNNQSIKLGLWDLNSEFDAIDPAGLFINSSHGIGADYSQSGENGPSIYPVSSLTLRYANTVNERFSYQIAVLDAVPGDPNHEDKNTIDVKSSEGALLAFEVNYFSGRQRYGLGSWYYSEKTATINGGSKKHNHGVYGFVRHNFMTAENSGEDLSGWLRYGVANGDINQLDSYFGAGIVYGGFLSSRPDDNIGLAIAHVRNGHDYRRAVELAGGDSDSHETNIELTYRAPINEFLTLQPDIQYIINPGSDPSLKNALVFGLRFELSLN